MANKYDKKNKEITREIPKYEKAIFRIDDVDKDDVIINVNGWRMSVRVIVHKNTNIEDLVGKIIEVEYIGDVENPTKNTPKFNIIRL